MREWTPFRIGNRFIVSRDNAQAEDNTLINIKLSEGRAFGSGEHETTASCIRFLEEIGALKGMTVLDLGCGTGILSLASAFLGAEKILAVDIDPDAVRTTENNIGLNSLAGIISVIEADIDGTGQEYFDLIIANIYADIILDISEKLKLRLKKGGFVLLSGIRQEYAFDVKHRFEHSGFRLIKTEMLDEFTTCLLQCI